MNSEVPQIPESEPIQELTDLESSNVSNDLNDLEAEVPSQSESAASSSDMWDEADANILDVSVAEETTEISEATFESINSPNFVEESEQSLEVTFESASQESDVIELSQEATISSRENPESKPAELFTDTWLDESVNVAQASVTNEQNQDLTSQIADLEKQKANLIAEIRLLEKQKEETLSLEVRDVQKALEQMVEEGMRELRERRNGILTDIEKLERRRERIQQEMRTNFAGVSQDLAVRVQGFKEYLVGSLQDLVSAAEQMELTQQQVNPVSSRENKDNRRDVIRAPRDSRDSRDSRASREPRSSRDRDNRDVRSGQSSRRSPRESSRDKQPQFNDQAFADQSRKIRQILEQYRTSPDYYGPPWQLRRTFEPIHEERVKDWFFAKGGRGAIKGVGSRLQNILVSAAVISVLYRLYRDRCRVLVLVDTPEKLGEWRRGLQDCLGITRGDFGSSRGVVLFESADVLVQRAERLLQDKLLPVVIIDETEELVNLSLLKFPLWLAFAAESQSKSSGYFY